MNIKRRNFIKKSGLVAASGMLIPKGLWSIPAESSKENDQNIDYDNFYIENASILTMDEKLGNFEKASILVQNGKITALGPDLKKPQGVKLISGEGSIVLPGLIDNHWHTWTSLLRSITGTTPSTDYFKLTADFGKVYTPEDMLTASRYAAAEAINAGITTINDYNHNSRGADYIRPSFMALKEMGLNGHVSCGYYRQLKDDQSAVWDAIEEIRSEQEVDSPISLGFASRAVGHDTLEKDWERARDYGMQIAIHASSTPEEKGDVRKLYESNLLKEDVHVIHGNCLTGEELGFIKQQKSKLTSTPFSEMRVGFPLPQVNLYKESGVLLGLGNDSTALTGTADLFSAMKLMLNLGDANAQDFKYIKPMEMLRAATIDGAKILGKSSTTGSLSPGKNADLIMLRKNDLGFSSSTNDEHLVVTAAHPSQVDLVCCKGKILKENGRLTQVDPSEIIRKAEESLARLKTRV